MDINATIIGQTIAMIVFVWFCMKFVWPPIMAAIEERQTQIADGLAAAEKGQRELSGAKDEAAKAVAEARTQASGIIDQANARAAAIVEEARGEAEAEKVRIVESGHADVELERNRVRDELRTQVAAIAVAGAEKILAREIDPAAHQELLDRLAGEL